MNDYMACWLDVQWVISKHSIHGHNIMNVNGDEQYLDC